MIFSKFSGFSRSIHMSPGWLRRCFTLFAVISIGISISKVFETPSDGVATAAGPEQVPHELSNVTAMIAEQDMQLAPPVLQRQFAPKKFVAGSIYPIASLEPVDLSRVGNRVILNDMPRFTSEHNGQVLGISKRNEFVFYTLDSQLQKAAQELVRKSDAPHIAIVAMEPKSGRILAIAEKSNTIKNLSLHAGLPAASLFKIVTTAAALESDFIQPYSVIRFRGGDYTLNKWNYKPDTRKDKRSMTVYEALGKSCNVVFGRIALNYLSPSLLRRYVNNFGFNNAIGFEYPIPESSASIPEDDFGLTRTAAGFGDVYISPVHAAALMSGVANDGLLPRPRLVNELVNEDGEVLYRAHPEILRRIVGENTAGKLLKMMESTTTVGTSKSEFFSKKRPLLPVSVAAKTGTLSGVNPKGVNHWFVAAAPLDNPKIAVSVIVVNPGKSRTKASRVGREIIEEYLF